VVNFAVTAETGRTPPEERPLERDPLDQLRRALAAHRGVAGAAPSGWTATVWVEAADEQLAIADSMKRIIAAARAAELEEQPLIVTRVATDDLPPEVPELPELVGSGEVLSMLNISKQRLHQLRASAPFPLPVSDLMSGPIWTRASIEAWGARNWKRRAGRRPYRSFTDRTGTSHGLGLVVVGVMESVAVPLRVVEDEPVLGWIRGRDYPVSEGFRIQDAMVYVPLEDWDSRDHGASSVTA